MPASGWGFVTRVSIVCLLLSAAACSDDDTSSAEDADKASASYALLFSSSSVEENTTYVSLLDSVGKQTIDAKQAREFSGTADLWVLDGAVYVAEAEKLTITKFSVKGHELVEEGALSFADYGISSLGFYVNVFISNEKAYVQHDVIEYIAWNPKTMEITGTIEIPSLEKDGTLEPFGSYMDRAAVVKDGKLYQPIYWTDDTYFQYTPYSKIAVVDTKTDEFVEFLDAPCPGLDYATVTDAGDVYFSSWIFAPGAAAVLDQPGTCVAKLADDGASVDKAFDVKDITDGREGGAFLYRGNDRAMLSVLDAQHGRDDGGEEVSDIAYGANWRFWSYDLKTEEATVIEDFDWNAGSAYPMKVGDKTLLLVPAGDYANTTIYDVSGEKPELNFEAPGWATRLFELK